MAQANEPLNEDGTFVNDNVAVRDKAEIIQVPKTKVDLIDVSPRQVVSVSTSMIPFLENDDATRCASAGARSSLRRHGHGIQGGS